jgi:hypothetical protein
MPGLFSWHDTSGSVSQEAAPGRWAQQSRLVANLRKMKLLLPPSIRIITSFVPSQAKQKNRSLASQMNSLENEPARAAPGFSSLSSFSTAQRRGRASAALGTALIQQWVKLPRLLALAAKNVKTNLARTQLAELLTIYRGVPDEDVRTFTMPGRAGWAGDASVVFLDRVWVKRIGALLFSKIEPPQDEVLVANATGDATFDRTVVAALRGGGWNVRTYVDEPAKKRTRITGVTPAAQSLAQIFSNAARGFSGSATILELGADVAPQADP